METPGPTIQELFPELNQDEQKEAEENLEQYLAVVIRIYQRISLDSEALEALRQDLAELRPVVASDSRIASPEANLPANHEANLGAKLA